MNRFIARLFLVLGAFLLMQYSYAQTLEFAQVGDVHYTLNNEDLDKNLYFLALSIKKKSPEFVVFLGDNVNRSREEDVIGFMRNIYPIRKPCYLAFGDTDAHSFAGLEKLNYLDIVTAFNKNQDEKKNYYYFKPNSDFICVVLDDTSEFAQSKHGEIPQQQLDWLEGLLVKYPRKLFIIFHHCPIMPPRDEYKLSMINGDKYKNLLKKYNNILMVSTGHYHQSAVLKDEKGVRHISAPAFMNIPHSYQLIMIDYDENSYKSPKDVQITVTEVKV